MENIDWDEKYQEISSEAFKLYKKQRRDYIHDDDPKTPFLRTQNLGIEPWKGVLIRLGDKFNLLEHYVLKGKYESHSESLRETLLDICSYTIIAIILLENYPESQ